MQVIFITLFAMGNARQEVIQRWWDQIELSSRMLGRVGADEICCDGLTQRQCAILRNLVAQKGARLSDLATSSGITPSAMTRVLERLEARGMVERVRGSHADGRAASVRITSAGRRVRKLLDELMRERTAQIVGAIPVNQRTSIFKALERLNTAIEALDFCGLNAPVQKLANVRRQKERRS